MQEVYEDEEELQPVELRRDAHDTHDTEVTLGPMRLVGIFCGLVLVCGLCFGLGYVVGRHKGQQPPPAAAAQPADATQTTAAAQTNPPANAAPPKPSAAPQTAPASAPAQQPADGQPETPSGDLLSETNPAASPQSVSPPSGSGNFPAAAAVHPALPQPMQSSPQWMVQIAAVAWLLLPPHGRRPVRGDPGRKKPLECEVSVYSNSENAIEVFAMCSLAV
jgi:pyruvate/2-oxoglutarate dehydrogenase complex dihydrolipoamide acyltransferase (E2) component